jgi:predicted transposase YdaD
VTVRDADIEEGEELTTSYVNIHWPGPLRRETLKTNYGFDCRCERCVEELAEEATEREKRLDEADKEREREREGEENELADGVSKLDLENPGVENGHE